MRGRNKYRDKQSSQLGEEEEAADRGVPLASVKLHPCPLPCPPPPHPIVATAVHPPYPTPGLTVK